MEILLNAAKIIGEQGVVIAATETFYALAADPRSDEAVARIFNLKGRPADKPLPLIAAQTCLVLEQVEDPSDFLQCLVERFWPGSLTLVVSSKLSFAPRIGRFDGKIAVRVPPDCPARRIAAQSGGWLTATSVNRAGEDPADRVSAIPETILEAVDMLVDSGPTPGGLPSTIIEPLKRHYRILRQGVVPEEDIKSALRKCS